MSSILVFFTVPCPHAFDYQFISHNVVKNKLVHDCCVFVSDVALFRAIQLMHKGFQVQKGSPSEFSKSSSKFSLCSIFYSCNRVFFWHLGAASLACFCFVATFTLILALTNKCLKFFHWNLNSICARDKIKIPLIETYDTLYKYGIIAISESMLDQMVNNDEIHISQ